MVCNKNIRLDHSGSKPFNFPHVQNTIAYITRATEIGFAPNPFQIRNWTSPPLWWVSW